MGGGLPSATSSESEIMRDLLGASALPAKVPTASAPTPPVLCRAAHSAAALIGNTPVLRMSAPLVPSGRGFWAKLEGFNPGGIKDRAAMHMVLEARRRGDLLPGARIIESTSGTLGLGLALAGLVLGHPVTLVTDPGLEPSMARLLRAHGAIVDAVTEQHPTGGWQQARRDRVAALLDREPTAWCPDQYGNPDNVAAYSSLALELVSQLGQVDVLVCSVGTGGHSAGILRALRDAIGPVRLVGVDAVGSTIFGQPVRPRLMRGLGNNLHPHNVAYDDFSEVHWVGPAAAVWTCRALARSHYATGGWSVGAVALVAAWLARTLPRDARIAAVVPDGPPRYLGTVVDDAYCVSHGLLGGEPAPQPDLIGHPMEREVVRWTRCTRVVDPLGGGRRKR